jgi:Domain of unknown function (DUF4908)
MRQLPGRLAGATLALLASGTVVSAQPTAQLALATQSCLPATATARALSVCFYNASVRASLAAHHEVSFETGADTDHDTALAYGVAAVEASDAVVDLASRAAGKHALARVTDVRITTGDQPSAQLSRKVLTVTIVPAMGASGVPSALEIERAMTA